jgi:hypothetical protein
MTKESGVRVAWKANSLSDEARQAALKAGNSEVEDRLSEIRK